MTTSSSLPLFALLRIFNQQGDLPAETLGKNLSF
jgi:hypothetical protein